MYASSYKFRDEMKVQLEDLLDFKFIKPSKSNHQSAILFVRKEDGSWRMCFDYRKLNSMTEIDNYPLPNICDIFTKCRGNRYFSKIDLRSGYHNIVIKEADRYKTAFITPWGLFEWSRLTFGFVNAQAIFQRNMDNIFRQFPFVVAYVDDIFIMSRNETEHMKHLNTVAILLHNHGLKVRLSKCHFFASELKYLGHIVT